MDRGEQTLRHVAFFETLAELDEASPAWQATSAGLLVLRLVDSWLDDPTEPAGDEWTLRAVREAAESVDAGDPARSILLGIVDAVIAAPVADPAIVAPRLLAYGRALDYQGKWRLGADIFQSVLARVHPAADPDLAIEANMQLGYCARVQAEWDQAARAYAEAGRIASAVNDTVKVLRVRIADAKLAAARGNLPLAASILDATIAQAADRNLPESRALALHERASVAHMRRNFEEAVRFGYAALQGVTSASARDRVLADLAAAFVELGMTGAGRDALLIVAATGCEQYVRSLATINLMELAAIEGAEPVFEQYRRELAQTELPSELTASYYLYVGQGYQAFGRDEQAREALIRALEVATEREQNQVVFAAEQALVELDRRKSRRAASKTPPRAVAGDVLDAASGISRMRVVEGV